MAALPRAKVLGQCEGAGDGQQRCCGAQEPDTQRRCEGFDEEGREYDHQGHDQEAQRQAEVHHAFDADSSGVEAYEEIRAAPEQGGQQAH